MTISKIAQLEKYGVRFQRLLLSHLPFIYSLIKLKHVHNKRLLDFWRTITSDKLSEDTRLTSS